jgi:hypothetical protein
MTSINISIASAASMAILLYFFIVGGCNPQCPALPSLALPSCPRPTSSAPTTTASPPPSASPSAFPSASPSASPSAYAAPQPTIEDPKLGCESSKGIVRQGPCCPGASDFPNTCLVGTCTCSPRTLKTVWVCDCPEDQCFDGKRCVVDSE